MTGCRESEQELGAALAAFRAGARAEADAHFDERALEKQRLQILQRLEHAGLGARVIPFPGAAETTRTGAPDRRRWVSAAAAAGLLVGLLTGQALHVLPGDRWVRPGPARPALPSSAAGPALVRPEIDPDDDLLDAVELAVSRRGASELRALEDLTFAFDPR